MKAFREGCAAFDDYKTYDDKDVPEVKCSAEQRVLAEGYKAPEVLVQDDFVASATPVACPADPTPDTWDCFMNDKMIPQYVAQYGYTLQDNFHAWPMYIAQHHSDPATLLMADNTHLSDPQGTDLMFEQTAPHLCYVP